MQKFLRILLPSTLESVVILPFSAIVIVFTLFSQLFNKIVPFPEENLTIENSIRSNVEYTFTYLNEQPFTAYFANVIFWVLFGSAVYIVLWIVINLVADFKKNLRVSHSFVHPESFHQSDIWVSFVLKIIFRLVSAVLLIIGGYYWLITLMPSLITINRFYVLENTDFLAKAVALISCYVLVALSLHLLAILLRMFFARSRSISS